MLSMFKIEMLVFFVLAFIPTTDFAIGSDMFAETDKYLGNSEIQSKATGFFRIQKVNQRWMFITPEGHGYFALGANHVGKYLDLQANDMGLLQKFGGDRAEAARYLIGQMKQMGLTAGEAYAPLAPELKPELPWVANLRFPAKSKFAFDVFDPKFQDRLLQSVVKQCEGFRDDPMVLGIAFCDLPVWDKRRINYFENLAPDSPGAKQLAEFRRDGKTDEQFLGHVADVLYAQLKRACKRGAPNHLFFGERHRLRGTPDEVLCSVGKHVDVFCTQALILSPQRPPEWQVFQQERYDYEQQLTGKPMMIIDWAAPFSLNGEFETEKGTLQAEKEAAEVAANWLVACMSRPYMVGVFKCQLVGLHGNDRWFEGKARRTYLRDDGTAFTHRTEITRKAHRDALNVAFQQAKIKGKEPRPNVIVIMSDDQGVGDYGFLGNEVIRTPSLDAMFERSGYLSKFYVSPVCAPTRASLMTGRYNYRTRCIDTFKGRAMMDTDEVTIAELLNAADYRTGIFGKWHLGDCYPMRPMDQGFEESLIHRGGGIGQRSDPIGAERKYTDPTLIHNGVEKPMKGYCTDIYFDAAMTFIENSSRSGDNFFAYIATNAPHAPYHDVPKELLEEYRKVDFTPILVGKHNPKRLDQELDTLARVSAMITNIDENVGRLFNKLDELKIREDTIVVYLNDNGPNTWRYVGEMRGKKGGVDEGGIRSPLLFHWPAKVAADKQTDETCAHIDLLPTIMDACNVKVPPGHQLDGRSFLPLLTKADAGWPRRPLVIQAHRGNEPQRYHHFSLIEGPWKLVHPTGFNREQFEGKPKLELYHLGNDPRQAKNLIGEHPDVASRLKKTYDNWFNDVSSTRPKNYDVPRIVIGTELERRTVLTAQDLRTHSVDSSHEGPGGFWHLRSAKQGEYTIEVVLSGPLQNDEAAKIFLGGKKYQLQLAAGKQRGHLIKVEIPAGEFRLGVAVSDGEKETAAHQVVISH